MTVWTMTNCGKFLKMGKPDHLTCFLRNLYAGQEATVRTRYGTMGWFKIRKGVHQGCIFPHYLFNLYAECIMQNTRLDESQAGIKIAQRNINTKQQLKNEPINTENRLVAARSKAGLEW